MGGSRAGLTAQKLEKNPRNRVEHGGGKAAREEAGNDEVWIFMQSQKEDHAKSKRGPIRK
jgi:hypothetical protein